MADRKRASLFDYEEDAKLSLNKESYTFFTRGIQQNQTRDDSVNAFKRYRLRPRTLKDVSSIDISTTVLGYPLKTPIGVAPSACHTVSHPDGEVATITGLHGFGSVMILSAYANKPVAEVVQAAGDTMVWMNLYFFNTNMSVTKNLIRQAEKTGCKALVVTIDDHSVSYETMPVPSSMDYMLVTDKYRAANFVEDILKYPEDPSKRSSQPYIFTTLASATMADLRWLKSFTKLPIILKGILTGESALKAAIFGVDGIIVSAHGGRNLDTKPAPIDVLAEVTSSVQGYDIEVYMDGGIRTGTDVLKALALGARAVFTARPFQWGLAIKGSKGTKEIIHILREELILAMAFCGCRSLKEVTPSLVIHESQYLASKL